jgi:hypothetical protein
MKNQINLFNVNTTAFAEEDFLILTNLTEQQIIKVIEPMVLEFRNGDSDNDYDNDMLIKELEIAYPNAIIQMYCADNLDSITI